MLLYPVLPRPQTRNFRRALDWHRHHPETNLTRKSGIRPAGGIRIYGGG